MRRCHFIVYFSPHAVIRCGHNNGVGGVAEARQIHWRVLCVLLKVSRKNLLLCTEMASDSTAETVLLTDSSSDLCCIFMHPNLATKRSKEGPLIYDGASKIFRIDAVKTIKPTIRPIGRHHPRISFLPFAGTGPTTSSIFGKLPGGSFLSECQALSAIRRGSPKLYQTGFLSASISFFEIGRSHSVPNQGSTMGGG
jgi:hypothetical protein